MRIIAAPLAKTRAAEAGRASGRRDDPLSVVARLRAAHASDAADGAELALAVDAAFEAADARHDVPVPVVSGLAVGLDDARRETRRDQQQHCNSLTHETAPLANVCAR